MFGKDYHEPTDKELQKLVLSYEESVKLNQQPFLEESSYELIIDYYLQQDEPFKAIIVSEYAINQFPYSAVFLTRKAEIAIEQKNYDDALESLDKAELLDPNNINVYLFRADIHLWNQEHRQAVSMIKKAISFADKSELDDLYLEMADIYEDWEKFPKVVVYLKKALKHNPDNEEALNRMWFCYEMTEDYPDSILFHKELIDNHPYNYLAWYNLAYAYEGINDFERAKEAFDFVIAINEDFESAYVDCAELLSEQEKFEEAIEYYKEVIKIDKPSKEVYFSIADCYNSLGNYTKARHYFKRATKIDPHFSEAFFRIGTCYEMENKTKNAISAYERAVKLSEDNTDYLLALAEAYHDAELFDDSIQTYYELVSLDHLQKAHWITLSTILFDLTHYGEAIHVLKQASEEIIDNAEILYVKSMFHYQLGEKKQSFEELEKALSKNYVGHYILKEINATFVDDPDIRAIIEQYKP